MYRNGGGMRVFKRSDQRLKLLSYNLCLPSLKERKKEKKTPGRKGKKKKKRSRAPGDEMGPFFLKSTVDFSLLRVAIAGGVRQKHARNDEGVNYERLGEK